MKADALFRATKTLVDESIQDLVTDRKRTAFALSDSYGSFWERIERVTVRSGKRIRPYLTAVGYGEINQQILPVAIAQELVHIAMLMHDDVIDQDFARHGKPNMNGLYRDAYGQYLDKPSATHYANSAAVLAGDALLSEAYQSIQRANFSDTIRQKLIEQLGVSIFEVIGGELMDVEAAFVSDQQFDPLTMYRYKTASYSFIGPLVSGAYCANMSTDLIACLEEFATAAGIAYQLQDDLLGVFGDEQQTGKSTISDLREGKQTMLVTIHRSRMNDDQQQRFELFGDQSADDDRLRDIKRDMEDSGARKETEILTDRYFRRAATALETLPDGDQKDALETFLQQLHGRNV